MHYLLFIPRKAEGHDNNIDLTSRLSEVGLADHVAGAMPCNIASGPDGLNGFIIGWGNVVGKLQYKPDAQTWVKSVPRTGVDAGAYYIGIWNDSPPTEGELRREYTQTGKFVPLGSDRWKIPTPDTVDKHAVYNDDGSMRWETVRQFAWLVDEATKLQNEYLEHGSEKLMTFAFDPSEFVGWLLRLLRINYRLTPEVAAHLELFRAGQVADAVLASLGLQRTGGSGDD